MDKDWKLQRYHRKDYTDVVDFPVEIVGRDGAVRRYSFEDSIRLYQRRITFAPIRYRDDDLVQAEVAHCRSRIEQLRRSYFHRFGWGTPDGGLEPIEVFGELAGELAAFLCRILRTDGRPDVLLTPVADAEGAVSTWYLLPGDAEAGMLLYVYRFEHDEGEGARERFFQALEALDGVAGDEGDRERLLAFHHTVDCGFVLTSRADRSDLLEEARGGAGPRGEPPTPWEKALEVVRRGDFEEAIRHCREIVAAQPWHRGAYVAGAVLATALRRYYDAEDFALLGTCYFPEDGALHHHCGVARHHLGRHGEARASLEQALSFQPNLAAARFHLAMALVAAGEVSAARRVIREGGEIEPDHRRAQVACRRLGQWLAWRRVMYVAAAACLVLGLVGAAAGTWLGVIPLVLGAGIALAGALVFRRQVARLESRQRYDELSQGLRRIHQRPTPEPSPVV